VPGRALLLPVKPAGRPVATVLCPWSPRAGRWTAAERGRCT